MFAASTGHGFGHEGVGRCVTMPSYPLYLRTSASLNLLLLGALIWDHLGNASQAFPIVAGLMLGLAILHFIVVLASAAGKPVAHLEPLPEAPQTRGARRRPVHAASIAPAGTQRSSQPVFEGDWPAPEPVHAAGPRPASEAQHASERCHAIRVDGSRCAYECRPGSPHCGAHQGYRPIAAAAQGHAPAEARATPATPPGGPTAPPANKVPAGHLAKPQAPAHPVDAPPTATPAKPAPAKPATASRPAKAEIKAPAPRKAHRPRKASEAPKPADNHAPQGRSGCAATTLQGSACSNQARPNLRFCGIHKGHETTKPPTPKSKPKAPAKKNA